ncbi:amidase [Exophiala viscosa]|uniref:amidase n=1 Tax=Exophiala viscosa TaxID=2486360 RepID=A0AAN6E0T2_9EURO|nr:amidase [Exophiala viscosa]
MVKAPWQDVAQIAQDLRAKSIADIKPAIPDVPSHAEIPLNTTSIPRKLLGEAELNITESPPEELLRSLASGQLSSVEVVTAFLRRAGIAQTLANCVTEVLPKAAIERATYLDEYLKTNKKPIGPLHGLPISVKEHIGMKGLGLNGGFVSWWDHVGKEDAHIIQLLQNAGCVLYVRTTQPQCLMHLETANNLYGVTVNPYNRNLTSGGSSGGEGVLIALKGSCLGIGTDIGGSIRAPSANNGIWGFKPTSYRLPMGGMTAPMAGSEQIVAVVGPMSASFEGCHVFMKTLIDQKPWLTDPALLPMPWTYPPKESYLTKPDGEKKLKIGIIWSDGVVKPHPPVIRAIQDLTAKLKSIPEVELVDWKPYKHDLAWDVISALYFCDGAKQEKEALASSGEPWLPLTEFIIKEQPQVPDREFTISEVWQRTVKRDEYRKEYAKAWTETAQDGYPVDVILCPVGPGAAPPLNQSRYWGYTAQWNLLDYPAMIFPVTQLDPKKDPVETGYQPLNAKDEFNYKLYEPEKYVDAPVSLQLVGRRYDDEKVFEAMEFIQKSVGHLPLESFK